MRRSVARLGVVLGWLAMGGCTQSDSAEQDSSTGPVATQTSGDPSTSSTTTTLESSSGATSLGTSSGAADSGTTSAADSSGSDETAAGSSGGGTEAVARGLIAQYTFEGEGTQVADVSGAGDPLDLTMYREEFIERIDHGVRFLPTPDVGEINGPDYTTPIIRSLGAADKINTAIVESDAFTLEVWLRPTELAQSGPGRMVSIDFTNYDNTNFNAMHGPPNCGDHGPGSYFQLRMGGTGNACPALPVPAEPNVTGELQHFVLTQDGTAWVLYLDGAVNGEGEHPDTPAGWNAVAGLALGNLPSIPDEGAADGNFRGWVGELFYVGWHDVALSADEVQTNFAIPYAAR